jgi:hybrid cluster-associated redox disulfide protein
MKTSKKRKTKKIVNSKMSFAEVIKQHPESAEVFSRHGMLCFGCPAAMMEKLEDGIKAHGQDVDEIVNEINEAIKKKK